MTYLNPAALPASRVSRPAVLLPWLVAAALVVLMGLPALTAPKSEIAPDGWHGNSASAQALR